MEKTFVEIRGHIFYLDSKEMELLKKLKSENLLQWSPKIVEVYGFEKGGAANA